MLKPERPRILLVDDEACLLDGLLRTLRPFFDVTAANSADEALNLMAHHEPYQVIVSDLRMPGTSGLTLLNRVRELSPAITRILLTGHGDLDAVIASVNEGNVFRILSKPCPPWVLMRALEDAVRQHQDEMTRLNSPTKPCGECPTEQHR